MYGIWVEVGGGQTGYRASWLKGKGGTVALFPSFAEAALECANLAAKTRLRGGVTPSGRQIAVASYRPRALSIRGPQ